MVNEPKTPSEAIHRINRQDELDDRRMDAEDERAQMNREYYDEYYDEPDTEEEEAEDDVPEEDD